MATILDTVVDYENKALDLATQAQDPIVDYVGKAAEFVGARLPESRPELPVQPSDVVKTQFAFAKKVLAANEKFANALLNAAAPVLGSAKPKAKTVKAA